MIRVVTYAFFVRMRRFVLILDLVDILCSLYSNFSASKMIFEVSKLSFSELVFYLCRNLTLEISRVKLTLVIGHQYLVSKKLQHRNDTPAVLAIHFFKDPDKHRH